MLYDCAVIGGGPAGMSASLVLGRARRNVILFDDNEPRNAVTRESHGFLTRDGVKPNELKKIARTELSKYPSIILQRMKIASIRKGDNHFSIETLEGELYSARKIIFATGVKEALPNIEGIQTFYGNSIYSCPYCDGWEMKEKAIAIISNHQAIFESIKLIYNWSKNLIVCTDGSHTLSEEEKSELERKEIQLFEQKVKQLVGNEGMVKAIRFADGVEVPIEGGFITPEWVSTTSIAQSLGCEIDKNGGLNTDGLGRTNIEGIYAAGDVTTPSQVVIAAGEGSKAAIGVNTDLTNEDFVK
ncbi:NAD(P)/FAD-dependent oxidoreductase [Bacillus massiliigorillae]|uniref:NAD(P)/FAD-dependent oxidoreductase n=1 Tax=Bacillus massiliigorillae TaxID=1243664 RepID=UPI00039AD105|nr:NAD(P)/FAD-dependent oxidoreductase [Bacillus massiliigorillae]